MDHRKIRVGILGLGRAGRFMHAVELACCPEHFEITAGADNAPERTVGLPPEFANAKLYNSLEAMLTDENIDMITVATRNASHVEQAIQIMQAGKIAVLEKPVAISVAQAEALKAAAEKFPGKLFFRFNRRFEAGFTAVMEAVKSGIIGEIKYVKINRCVGFYRRSDWQTLSSCHGGLLNNWGPHMIDQARQFINSPIADIWCSLQHYIAAGDAEDQVKLLLKGENGCVADIDLATAAMPQANLYEVRGTRGGISLDNTENTMTLRYLDPEIKFGPLEAGEALYPLSYDTSGDKLKFIDEVRKISTSGVMFQRGRKLSDGESINAANGYTHSNIIWYFIYDSIVNNAPYPISIDDGIEVVRITEAARNKSGFVPHKIY